MRKLFNDGWQFLKLEADADYRKAMGKLKEFRPVSLPHDWLIYDSGRLYEDSSGWYVKTLVWEKEGKRAFLIFDGIYMDSTVYVNGKKAGEWKYGYSAFTLDITDYIRCGENQIAVQARFLSPNSRWYSGAGIYRDVWLKVTGETYLEEDGIYINAKRVGTGPHKEKEDFKLSVDTAVGGIIQDRKVDIVHTLFFEGTEIPINSLHTIEGGDALQEFLVKRPKLWDIESPCLYVLHTSLSVDGIIAEEADTRFGFRYPEFHPDKGFFLNGRKVKLNGVCEHHDLGCLGAAFNKSAMERKFRILKEMGVNAVRGTHNMMAPGFMDLADEMGILVISEAFDMWERSKTTYDYARFFTEWAERDVKSWVKRDRNHPGVIMWSIGNEIYDTHADERGQEITRRLQKMVNAHDPRHNAGITIGSNYMPWENARKCADIVKLAGYNYSEKYYQQHHEEHPDWVIYGSETSSIVQSRGVYHFPLKAGILAEDDEQCSALGNSATSWGAKSMEDCVCLDRDMDFSMGQFLWTGFDYIGEPTPYHTKNSYFGQVDTAGFPKDAYYVWKSAWTDYKRAPMVHVFPYWDFNVGQQIDVRVCSNGPEVELFLNEKSLGRQNLTHDPGSGNHIIADYQVLYEEGELRAVAYDENGQSIAVKVRKSFGNSHSLTLKAENTRIQANSTDLLFIEIGTLDKEGRPVENAADRVKVSVEGAGRLLGLDNGDSTDYDSYKGISRRLFQGKLLAVVGAKMESGAIKVQVSGKGLLPAELICEATEEITTSASSARVTSYSSAHVFLEENEEHPIVLGREEEIPVRKIVLTAPEGNVFSPDKKEMWVEAAICPADATDKELFFRAVNDSGVTTNLAVLKQEGNRVHITARGDGSFRLRCMSKSGTEKVRLISQLEFNIKGMGEAFLNPYEFISGSLYTSVKGEAGNGNERGIATARDGETVISYEDIDFGDFGSDEITVPIFALSSEEYPIQIWEGVPGEEGSELLAEEVYQKPSIWNVYQPETWKLKRRIKGVSTLSFLVRQKIHIKGFSFTGTDKARAQIKALEADAIYGDSFVKTADTVEKIGNNVSLEFEEMDFKEEGISVLTICGRSSAGNNTIHVRFFDGSEESKQIVEFQRTKEYEVQTFSLNKITGKQKVTFMFMPGSNFDFQWFRFE